MLYWVPLTVTCLLLGVSLAWFYKFPDLLKRDFTADRPNARRVGDMTEIPTVGGKLYLTTVIDL